MDIAIFDETNRAERKHLNLIEQLIVSASKKLELGSNFEMSVTIVDNNRIHEINREYRKIDRPTDVISFAIEDNDEEDFEIFFETLDNEEEIEIPRLLGDIFISIDKAEEQAKEFGHSLDREIGFLAVHGFLHLNGYDHQTEEEEYEMFSLQDEILKENDLERK
ncbi:MAG TPA: rRNA maturation RNase YbeY [Atopostipes sp.]|nr:rRNA maturation RNase YbeY [Atopostipes sp.]